MDDQETEVEKGNDSATNDEFTWKVPGPLAEFIDGRAKTASTIAMMATLFYSLDAADGERLIIDPGAIHLATFARAQDYPTPLAIAYFEWFQLFRPTLFKALSRLKTERLARGQKRVSVNDPRRDPTQLPPTRLTDDLSSEIIPYALRLSKLTSNRNRLDLRHLLYALAHYAPVTFPTLLAGFKILESEQMSESDAAGLKTQIAMHEVENPKSGDNIEAWRLLAELPLEEVEARLGQAQQPPKPFSLPDATGYQLDVPAEEDQLDREGFAEALAEVIITQHNKNVDARRANEKRKSDQNYAHMLHLDGPWGSGKSTVLNFLRKQLEPDWLVVDYNAWKLQRLEPSWWTVITQIQLTAEERTSGVKRASLWLHGRLSRLRAYGLPAIVGISLVTFIFGLGLWRLADPDKMIGGITAIVTALGAVYAFSRTLVFGAGNSMHAIETLKSDPYRSVMAHFDSLVRAINKPIIVFIDDLDRCEAPTISALIEGIQTMLRGTPITYLVAADRKWLCTGFAERYKLFAEQHPEAGRPLGYLFLEKIFQISTSLPTMSEVLRQAMWNNLLGANASLPQHSPEESMAIQRQAEADMEGLSTQGEMEAVLAAEPQEGPRKRALRRVAARQVASREAVAQTEHRLSQHPYLMGHNPRGMKRLLNAVTMSQSRLFTEGRPADLIEIARWTALELRWPLLAEAVAAKPDLLDTPQTSPTGVLSLLGNTAVKQVLGDVGAEGQLTSAVVTRLVG